MLAFLIYITGSVIVYFLFMKFLNKEYPSYPLIEKRGIAMFLSMLSWIGLLGVLLCTYTNNLVKTYTHTPKGKL